MPSSSLNEWSISMLTGGIPINFPYSNITASIFSNDGRYLIVTLTHQIRIYFISTKQCIKTIDIDLTGLVDIKLDINNPNQILLFKQLGEILTINYKDKLNDPIISTTSIQLQSQHNILSVVNVKHNNFIIVTGKKDKKKGSSPHTRYILSIDRTSETIKTVGEIQNSLLYSISLDLNKLAFVLSDHKVLLLDLETYYNNEESEVEDIITKELISYQYRSPITSIAVSNDSIIALGTNSGVIQVIYGGIENETQRILKWHIEQINALQFSSDNNYLISGGSEKVLVFWQLETEKKQFLPRLNGIIDKINIDNYKNDYIQLLLKTDINNYEILILCMVDLVSRLSINTIRPKFSNNLRTTLQKTKKKFLKDILSNKLKLKYDYSCKFEIHPKTKNLYFPNESSIQSFDLIKNEQNFIQNAASTISTGKVRSEINLTDPQISLLKFTSDGDWMCTYDEVIISEVDSIISSNEKQFALKFWKYLENDKDKSWELTTIIMDPHGKNPILSLIPAPTSYFGGVAFLTADNKGGVRVWRPTYPKEIYKTNNKSQQISWSLRKFKPSSNSESDSISLSWSDDSSIIFLSHECSITCIDSKNFDIIDFQIPILTESKIRSIQYLDNKIIVLSKTRFFVYDLIKAELTNLNLKIFTTSGGSNIITINPIKNLICLAINYYEVDEENLGVVSKLYIFKPNQLKPIYIQNHNSGIASIKYDSNSFYFIDLECRVGSIDSTLLNVEIKNITNDISSMLLSAQANVDLISFRENNQNKNGKIEDSTTTKKVIDLHTFQPIFQNINGLEIETIFDRITNILK
ncbi:NAN1 [Candida pseudojiufengensis]|uniref:NAN1 n=1 Tax=Candida pseudojiufengensis TaxID=497109 RepID=UPI0022253B2C|nr:NAN1 [Candida pseudojiufengensis]KAI5965682.1 NAN1 [Candida pseudojiufengensis]